MNNLPLQPLVWDWSYGDGGKTNAVCRAKSPSHEYIIRLEAGGDCYVDYRKFDNDEDSDNRKDEPPVFDSIKAAQDWVQSTHYPSKMQPYVRPTPTWISVEDRLPEMHKRVLIKADCYLVAGREPKSERNKDWGISGDWMWAIVNDSWTDSHMVTHWMPIPEFSTMKNNKGE